MANSPDRQGKSEIFRSEQGVLNLSFDELFKILAVMLVAYDPDTGENGTSRRLEITPDGLLKVFASLKGAGSNANIKDDTYYGDGLTSGILSIALRAFNGEGYDRVRSDGDALKVSLKDWVHNKDVSGQLSLTSSAARYPASPNNVSEKTLFLLSANVPFYYTTGEAATSGKIYVPPYRQIAIITDTYISVIKAAGNGTLYYAGHTKA